MIKRILFYITSAVYLLFSSYLMPIFILFAFNYMKGIANNEDGILFIPIGFIFVILTIVFDVLLIRKALKLNNNSKRNRLIVILFVAAILIIAVILNLSEWQLFFECFSHFKGLNLELQR